MTDSLKTLETRGSTLEPVGRGEPEVSALMIAWAPAEPHRVGEVALFEADGASLILGRGPSADRSSSERVVFHRQRPGVLEPTPPLASPGISREQLRVRREGRRLRVERIGRCPMIAAGERVDRCVLAPGDTLLLKGQILLCCTRRPRKLPAPRSAGGAGLPAFGLPDAHGIVGESPAAWRLRDEIAWLAEADEHTLLLGASGTGKELAARAVHALSARAGGPFVARNAATIPAGLMEAELFGNVKGYPNPGMPERPGLIGAAHGGTLFLDEIGELPEGLQANLLRVLDEGGEYHCLGGSAARRSSFRLLGATNRDPAELKHDLCARLVLRLELPDLDARRDDIPLLARHLLRRAAAKSPEATRRFMTSPDGGPAEPRVKASLVEHLLRGRYATNVRELDAVLWRAMSQSTGDAIELPRDPAASPPPNDGIPHAGNPTPGPPPPPPPPAPPPAAAPCGRGARPPHASRLRRPPSRRRSLARAGPRQPRRARRQRRADRAGARPVEPVRALPAHAPVRHHARVDPQPRLILDPVAPRPPLTSRSPPSASPRPSPARSWSGSRPCRRTTPRPPRPSSPTPRAAAPSPARRSA